MVGPFQYIWWESLDVLVDNGMHLDVYIVGDDGTAKRELRVMCSGMPFRFRDAGRLRQAQFIEHMTLFTGALGPLYRDGVRMRGDVTGEEEMRAPVDIDSETQVFFHDGRDKENIMPHYTYLIIGGGMTADAAVHGIRQQDAHSSIGLISAESDPPYDRPPLSKGLWQGTPLEKIWRRTTDQGVTLHLGRTAHTLDPNAKQVIDDQHTIYTFDKLLLATGGTPRRLGGDNERIIYFRTLEDYRRLRVLTETGQRFGVIGGGFIGAEMAVALAMNGKEVVMIFPGETIGGRIFPHDVGLFLNDLYRQKGVQVLAGDRMTNIETRGTQLVVHTSKGQELLVDGIVAGLGIEPNIELAQTSGLAVDNGIMVDAYLRTRHPDIYAAGDVAAVEQTALGKRIRVEHEDNANSMGRHAGRNMAGMDEPYHHLPFFYSDLFDVGYEAVGELDARLDTVTDWREPYQEGVIYYLETGRVRGVLLWNIWGQIEAARELIKAPGPFTATDLKGRLSD